MLDVAQVHDLLQGGSGIASAQEAAEGAAKGDTSDERADEESPVDAKAKRTTAMEAAFMFGEAYKLTGGQQAFPTKAATYSGLGGAGGDSWSPQKCWACSRSATGPVVSLQRSGWQAIRRGGWSTAGAT